nr:immunoglobulin light chain junction region [Macaca mulatta]MOX85473.1 immunoglobulin light chain junction region [Macaca mulatta]MOX85736.1 immunoglobulin light chain junction region [Macaca mulatta]MOX86664.1 immunoglobulin light chain junction region [Macaca mulatta]MOX87143.1 immunoglobulin light chain junction region [Macaca mulatta]
CMQNLEFPWTF